MDKLIQDINTCLLALYEGNKSKFKEFDLVGLIDQFEAIPKYKSNEFQLLRNAFIDILEDKQYKLKHYLSRIQIPNKNDEGRPDHEVIQDVYDWLNLDKEPFFERYINFLKNGNTDENLGNGIKKANKKNKSNILPFSEYLNKTLDPDKLISFLIEKYKSDSQPIHFAKWIYLFHDEGLLSTEVIVNSKYLFKNYEFINSLFIPLEGKETQKQNIKDAISTFFEAWETYNSNKKSGLAYKRPSGKHSIDPKERKQVQNLKEV